MKSLSNSTNGVMVLSDSFATTIFKEAFFRMFDKDENGFLTMGFNATFDVQVRFICNICIGLWAIVVTAVYRLRKNSRCLD